MKAAIHHPINKDLQHEVHVRKFQTGMNLSGVKLHRNIVHNCMKGSKVIVITRWPKLSL